MAQKDMRNAEYGVRYKVTDIQDIMWEAAVNTRDGNQQWSPDTILWQRVDWGTARAAKDKETCLPGENALFITVRNRTVTGTQRSPNSNTTAETQGGQMTWGAHTEGDSRKLRTCEDRTGYTHIHATIRNTSTNHNYNNNNTRVIYSTYMGLYTRASEACQDAQISLALHYYHDTVPKCQFDMYCNSVSIAIRWISKFNSTVFRFFFSFLEFKNLEHVKKLNHSTKVLLHSCTAELNMIKHGILIHGNNFRPQKNQRQHLNFNNSINFWKKNCKILKANIPPYIAFKLWRNSTNLCLRHSGYC